MTRLEYRLAVLEAAKAWLGTPWHHMARVRGAGVDCAQLLMATYSDAGVIEPFEFEPYPEDWMLHRSEERLLHIVQRYADEVQQPQPGDVALFRFGHCHAHGAIVVEWPLIIHAYRVEREVVWGDASQGLLADRKVRFFDAVSRAVPRLSGGA